MSQDTITIECPRCKVDVSVPLTSVFHQKVSQYREASTQPGNFVFLCPACDAGYTQPDPFDTKIVPDSLLNEEQKAAVMKHREIHIGLE
jgi:hypothetical protein